MSDISILEIEDDKNGKNHSRVILVIYIYVDDSSWTNSP